MTVLITKCQLSSDTPLVGIAALCYALQCCLNPRNPEPPEPPGPPKPPITPARQSYADSDDVICRFIAFWGHFRTPVTLFPRKRSI